MKFQLTLHDTFLPKTKRIKNNRLIISVLLQQNDDTFCKINIFKDDTFSLI